MSPSGPAARDRIAAGAAMLQELGFRVTMGAHVAGRAGFLAASDEQRLADLHEAFADPEVDVVAATRGGYGAQRLLDELDRALLCRSRAVFLGFSDLTALHVVLAQDCGRASLYGPGLAWDDVRNGAAARASTAEALAGESDWAVPACPDEPTAALTAGGAAEGILVGGNLAMLASAAGTRDALRPPPGALLLLEDVREAPYRIDRMLLQLARSGTLDQLAGLVLGQFSDCVGRVGEPDVVDVLGAWCDRLGVPVLGGIPVGHGRDQHTVRLNTQARFGSDHVLRAVPP
ncbi:MAG: LD-carboxypeptidase [Actinobacteria bacterium]|nr:LD-carboxypeptidase [Actinomycetota bacterium]